jgi:muramoyltetrapeptide carboxypeptidase LdcA involved in peptidoglycan recycling
MKIRKLKEKDTVAIITPGDTLPDKYSNQKIFIREYLNYLGYKIVDLTNPQKTTYQKQAQFLNRAFQDKNIKAVFPLCGGLRSIHTAKYLDYNSISKNPKIICGYGSLSYLLNRTAFESDIVTFYGPHLNSINPNSIKRESSYTIKNFWSMLREGYLENLQSQQKRDNYLAKFPQNKSIIIKNIFTSPEYERKEHDSYFFHNKFAKDSNISGRTMVSTLHQLEELFNDITNIKNNYILILDFFDLQSVNYLKILGDIKKSHIFAKCNGLVITNITTHGDFNLDHYYKRAEILQIIEDINNLFENNLNILYGFPIGHCVNKLTIPINSELTIDCKDGTMTFAPIN